MEADEPKSSVDEIPDALLAAILQRLPVESIFRFKCVSKRWLSIISDPFFVHSHITNNSHNPPWGFIFSRTNACKVIWFSPPGFATPGFSFDFHRAQWPKGRLKLVASHNGLLLSCSIQRNNYHFYHVWNPLTLKFVTVPPTLCREERQNVGFVVENDGSFWVVRVAPFHSPSKYLEFEVFTSSIGAWRSTRVCCARLIHSSAMLRPVVYKGVTHWLSGYNCIVFNPRNDYDHCRVIRTPGEHVKRIRKLLGISCNRLRYSEIHDLSSPSLRVWELVNYEAGEWSVVHEANLNIWQLIIDLDEDDSSLSGCDLIPVAFHPLDSSILFFECIGRLVSCELTTGNLQPVANMDLISVHELIPFVLPAWPTPIPAPSSEKAI